VRLGMCVRLQDGSEQALREARALGLIDSLGHCDIQLVGCSYHIPQERQDVAKSVTLLIRASLRA